MILLQRLRKDVFYTLANLVNANHDVTSKKYAMHVVIDNNRSVALFDKGIDVISRLKSVPADDAFASKTTKRRILYFRKYSKCKL